jgi:hypothetical protein
MAEPMKMLRFILLLPFALSACQSTSTGYDPESFTLPSSSRYNCGEGKAISVQNHGDSVTIVKPDGASIYLPAVEPGSKSRFGEAIGAIVFDGPTALFMETGKTPLNCRR